MRIEYACIDANSEKENVSEDFGKSFTYKIKSRGSRREPWATPHWDRWHVWKISVELHMLLSIIIRQQFVQLDGNFCHPSRMEYLNMNMFLFNNVIFYFNQYITQYLSILLSKIWSNTLLTSYCVSCYFL